MSGVKATVKRRSESYALQSVKRKHRDLEDDINDNELCSEIQGIVSALNHIREKAHKNGQNKAEETISSVAAEIRSIFEELKKKIEKDRQIFADALSKCSKECENALKEETAKFQAVYKKFGKEKTAHIQALKDTISKYEAEKEKLFTRYEQQRKKEKSLIQEKEKACADNIVKLEESLKKKKKDDRAFSLLRKTLGSILETASDEDVSADE